MEMASRSWIETRPVPGGYLGYFSYTNSPPRQSKGKMGERLGGRQKGTKNKATLERENMISRAMGELDRRRAASRPQRLLRGPQGPPPLRPTKHNALQARGISAMRSRPAISTRRMIGLTDGHPSFVLQTPSPRPSR